MAYFPLSIFVWSLIISHRYSAVGQDTGDTNNIIPDEPPVTKWYIETPEFRNDRLDLYLEYPVSDFIPYENVDWVIWDGPECGNGGATDITLNDYLQVEIAYDETLPDGDGQGWRVVTLSFTFDPDTIRNSPILSSMGLEQRLQFCVRLGAYTAPVVVPGAMEIVYKETYIDVLIQQDGNLGVDDQVVTPVNPGDEQAEILYKLRGYLCNETNDEIFDPSPIFQGMPTKVCVTPLDNALADGVYMRAIDTFYWTRETIYQPAIVPNQVTAPLTEITCLPGMIVCSFVTLLKADFFYKLGRVYGAGTGWLQFGRGDYTGDQRLMKAAVEFEFAGQDNRQAEYGGDWQNGSSGIGGPSTRQAQIPPRPEGADYSEYAGAGPFNVDIPVTRLYRAYGWLCDENNVELDPTRHPIIKGNKARVCVTPDDIAINQDNVRIRNIDSFTWLRADLNITQAAISTNAQAESRTEIFCQPGSLVCALETDLIDDFFNLPGSIRGSGVVWLQFGDDARRSMAVLMELGPKPSLESDNRNLQYGLDDYQFGASFLPYADPGFAGASPFDVILYVLPPWDQRELYRCRAYECDYDNKEYISFEPKTEGTSIRMCVKPSLAAEQVGAKMWSVEWWQWSQSSRVQDAIVKQGVEAPDGKTVSFCYRGMDICFFQTQLMNEFFAPPQPNGLNGNGVCWITFGDFAFAAPIFLDDDEQEQDSGAEIDPTADPLYAGHNDIAINFPTEGNYTFNEECPPEDHSLETWWEEEDEQMKTIYIAAMIAAASSLCCLWGSCLFFNRRDSEVDVEEEGGKVILNVDIEDHKTNTANTTSHYADLQESKEINMDSRDDLNRSAHSYASTDESESRPRFSGKRSDEDICFGDEEHPGTKDVRRTVRAYLRKNPDDSYGPGAFRKIKKKMGDCFFLVRDDKKRTWREAKKSETVHEMGEIWMEEKKRTKEMSGEYTRDDLKVIDRETRKKEKRSRKRDEDEHSEDEQQCSTGDRHRRSRRYDLSDEEETNGSDRRSRKEGKSSKGNLHDEEDDRQKQKERRNSRCDLTDDDDDTEERHRRKGHKSNKRNGMAGDQDKRTKDMSR